MSEPERPSEETKTEYIPKEAPPQTLEISEASLPPAPTHQAAPAPLEPPAAEPPAADRSEPLPADPAPASPSYPAAGSYAEAPYPEAPVPPTEAFVPPELMARRRAAAPPSTPYQPIAGWSMAPTPPVNQAPAAPGTQTGSVTQPGTATSAYAAASTGSATPAPATGAVPVGPANGFTTPPPGGPGQAGPAAGAQAPPTASSGEGGRPGWLSAPVLVGVGVLVIAGLVVGGIYATRGKPEAKTPTVVATTPAAVKPVEAKFVVSSYTTNGTGFDDRGSSWQTQTYRSATFGNLKKGIGLVLDLGSAKELTSVSFDAETGPMTVELHASDDKPAGLSGGKIVGAAETADGKTKLDASKGGKHQYWMIWVTKLGPTYKAVISDISATAAASAS